MVVLSEVQNMFWGVTLDGGKRYTQTVETSFHISCAALEVGTETGGPLNRVAVMIQHEKAEFVLCTLDNKQHFQQPLDLNFTEGEEVTFFLNGKGVVHLTGYLVPEDTHDDEFDGNLSADMMSDDDEDDDDDDSDEEIPSLQALPSPVTGKRKKSQGEQQTKKKLKQALMDEEYDDEDDEDDTDFSEEMVGESDDIDDDDEDDDDDDDNDDDESEEDDDDSDEEEDESDEEEEDSDEDEDDSDEDDVDLSGSFIQESTKKSKSKSPVKVESPAKAEKKTPKAAKKDQASPAKDKATEADKQKVSKTPKTATPGKAGQKEQSEKTPKAEKQGQKQVAANGATPNTESSKKKKKQQGSKKDTPASAAKPKKQVLAGGVVMEELVAGDGQAAKQGQTVSVYYKGTLKDGKVFDAVTSGKPFKFKLGKEEVIKGWDIGIKGMKVGSKRKLTIPAQQAYGPQKVGTIPPNSTLVFNVELKAVS